MLAGYVAGHYDHDAVHIDLSRIAVFAGARLYRDEVIGLDRVNRKVLCRNRPPVPYAVLSINMGATAQPQGVPGAVGRANSGQTHHTFQRPLAGAAGPCATPPRQNHGCGNRRRCRRRGVALGHAVRLRNALRTLVGLSSIHLFTDSVDSMHCSAAPTGLHPRSGHWPGFGARRCVGAHHALRLKLRGQANARQPRKPQIAARGRSSASGF